MFYLYMLKQNNETSITKRVYNIIGTMTIILSLPTIFKETFFVNAQFTSISRYLLETHLLTWAKQHLNDRLKQSL
jgi:hypothetical protein